MPDPSWKKEERRVAKMLGGTRAPLSGRRGSNTSGDVVHDCLYVECKQLSKAAVLTLFESVMGKAKREGKLPLLVIHKKGSRTRAVVMPFDLFLALWNGGQDGERQ